LREKKQKACSKTRGRRKNIFIRTKEPAQEKKKGLMGNEKKGEKGRVGGKRTVKKTS